MNGQEYSSQHCLQYLKIWNSLSVHQKSAIWEVWSIMHIQKKNSRFLSTYIWFGLPWWLSGKESTFQCRMWIWSLGQEDALEKEMVTHSSLLAWENPWTEEPGDTEGWGHKRVRDDLATEQQWFGLYREMGR